MKEEISVWCEIPEIPNYLVSNKGQVMRATSGRLLTLTLNQHGYLHVSLMKKNKQIKATVHKLVTLAFLGSCPKGKETNHKNGNKQDNRITNLEYVTPKENRIHAVQNNLIPKGSQIPSSKLTDILVLQIVNLKEIKKLTQAAIARRFSVTHQMISDIFKGKTWVWLTGINN